MGEKFTLYNDDATDKSSPAYKRRLAVIAALELIRADALGTTGITRSDKLEYNIERLSSYADKIQEALKT